MNNEVLDEVRVNLGVRSFGCTASEGFILKGLPTPLRGVSRHQDLLIFKAELREGMNTLVARAGFEKDVVLEGK